MSFALKTQLPGYLYDEKKRIEEFARGFGLDFFPTVFEVLNYAQMNEVAAFGGFPTRYPHWRFGMEYERLSKNYEYGLSKIYEMVINNTPSIAYLLEGNSMVEQKLVMAHVLGHVDFFKNNFAFSVTDQGRDPKTGEPIRKWIDTMANHGSIVRRWSNRLGVEKVEAFIDACLSLENLIDPNRPFEPMPARIDENNKDEADAIEPGLLRVDKDYMESFINPEEFVESQKAKAQAEREAEAQLQPTRDVLDFLVKNAPLERWERDILISIRREAYYFLPQMQTKIMNEGWASYWHSRLMTEKVCDGNEIIDYADRNAGVLATSGGRLNPYKLGVELFRHIERRWDRGQFGKEWSDCQSYQERTSWDRRTGLGRDKIFEARKVHNDLTFIDEYLTPDFVYEQKLFSFGYNERNSRYEIETRAFADVKEKLLMQLTNAGNPIIRVIDDNYMNRGELVLKHDHHGIDLKLDWAWEVMQALQRVWRRPVELHTICEEKLTALRFDGSETSKRVISSESE